jgi:hypothetical protein
LRLRPNALTNNIKIELARSATQRLRGRSKVRCTAPRASAHGALKRPQLFDASDFVDAGDRAEAEIGVRLTG